MARLVVKRTPWWVAHKKLVMVVLPLATLQAATLTGFGYFYHRLDSLEHKTDVSHPISVSTADMPIMAAVSDISIASPVPPVPSGPPVSAVDVSVAKEVLLQAATLLRDNTQQDKAVGQDNTVLASNAMLPPLKAKPDEVKATPKVEKKKAEPAPAAKLKKSPVSGDAGKTALANRAGLQRGTVALASPLITPAAEPVSAQEGRVWVYLGELRNYGWYDQKLHISPNSGLPEIGRAYRTQHIQGFYDVPYGELREGEFHLGEKVFIHDVRRGRNNDVWALVSGR